MFTNNKALPPEAVPVFRDNEPEQKPNGGEPNILAVYGTLRKGARASRMLRECTHIGTDEIYGRLYDLSAFPGIRLGGFEKVVVDLFKLANSTTLPVVDCYEGFHPETPDTSLYVRRAVNTIKGQHLVWVYEYNYALDGAPLIKSGDWFKPNRDIS